MSVPVFTKPDLKLDQRGWGITPAQALNRNSPIYNLHVVTLNPGAVRGNHYHQAQIELVFSLGGTFTFFHAPKASPTDITVTCVGPEPTLIEIPCDVIHVVKNDGDACITLVCFARNPTESKDQIKIEIVSP